MTIFINAPILSLKGHGQFSCHHGNWESIGRVMNRISLRKYVCFHMWERGRGSCQRHMNVFDSYHFYQLSVKSVRRKMEHEVCQQRFHIIKVKRSLCACVCACGKVIDHTLKSSVIKLLIVLPHSPEEMKGSVAMTTSALKGLRPTTSK